MPHRDLAVCFAGLSHDHIWNELVHWSSEAAAGRASLVACADWHASLVSRAVREFSIAKTFSDPLEMLNDASLEIDILQICSDNASHRPLVAAVCSRSSPPKCIVIEKPLAANLADGLEIDRLCREKNILLLVNWPTWKNPAWREVMERVRAGEIGTVRHVEFRGGHAGPKAFGCSEEFCEVGLIGAWSRIWLLRRDQLSTIWRINRARILVQWLYAEKRNGAGAFIDVGLLYYRLS